MSPALFFQALMKFGIFTFLCFTYSAFHLFNKVGRLGGRNLYISLPSKIWERLFPKKLFIWEKHFLGKYMGGCDTCHTLMTIIRSFQVVGSFINAFSNNLITGYIKIFPNHGGTFT